MHSIAINHGIIFVLHTVSSTFLCPAKLDESIKDAMKGALGYDVLTLSSSCPEAAALLILAPSVACCLAVQARPLVRTETHEDVWTGIDIIMLLAINEAIAALSHLIGLLVGRCLRHRGRWTADI